MLANVLWYVDVILHWLNGNLFMGARLGSIQATPVPSYQAPTSVAGLVVEINTAIGSFVPLDAVTLFVIFGAIVGAGVFLVKRSKNAMK